MLSNSLQNKKIIISAGASGIGWATTKICVAKGASVYLCDIDLKAINKVKKHPLYNKRIFVSEADASDETQVIDFFNQIKRKFKNLDALINNVGIEGPTRPIEKLDSNEWENTLHVNVNSHFYFTKQAIPLLKYQIQKRNLLVVVVFLFRFNENKFLECEFDKSSDSKRTKLFKIF